MNWEGGWRARLAGAPGLGGLLMGLLVVGVVACGMGCGPREGRRSSEWPFGGWEVCGRSVTVWNLERSSCFVLMEAPLVPFWSPKGRGLTGTKPPGED